MCDSHMLMLTPGPSRQESLLDIVSRAPSGQPVLVATVIKSSTIQPINVDTKLQSLEQQASDTHPINSSQHVAPPLDTTRHPPKAPYVVYLTD